MKKLYYFLIALIVLTSVVVFISCEQESISYNDESDFDAKDYAEVSMIDLIANPEKYDGKKVQVKGVAEIMFEDTTLYFSEESHFYLTRDWLWLNISNDPDEEDLWWIINGEKIHWEDAIDKYSGKYIEVYGTFDMNDHGHMAASRYGAIDVDKLFDRSDYTHLDFGSKPAYLDK